MAFRVVHAPFVFLRTAPAIDAAVHHILQYGDVLEASASHFGWVRSSTRQPGMNGASLQYGWALLDGSSIGLGPLLQPEPR